MYGALDIAVSGMIAQQTRMDVITANVVNQNVVLDSKNEVNPYRRRMAMFASGDPSAKTPTGRKLGVHVAEIAMDQTPFPLKEFNPDSPLAYKDGPHAGWIPGTNIDPVMETVNSMEAQRAYEACSVAAETAKTMMAQGLRLIA